MGDTKPLLRARETFAERTQLDLQNVRLVLDRRLSGLNGGSQHTDGQS